MGDVTDPVRAAVPIRIRVGYQPHEGVAGRGMHSTGARNVFIV